MKHKLIYIIGILIVLLSTSCSGNYKDINLKTNNINATTSDNRDKKDIDAIKTIEPTIVAKAFSNDEDLFLENNYFIDFNPKVKASSSLKSNTKISYDVKNIHDGDLGTAWVEGNKDYGIGEYIDFIFDKSDKSFDIRFVNIYNGYRKNKKLWEANSRVKRIKLWKNNEPVAILELEDTMDIQRFSLDPQITVRAGECLDLKLEVIDVYEGKKYKDTSITEIDIGSGI